MARPHRRRIESQPAERGRAPRRSARTASSLNGSSSVPSVVVPSGNTATMSPPANAAAAWPLTRRASRNRARSTNTRADVANHSPDHRPARASSDLATKRTGCTAFSTENVQPGNVVRDDQHIAGMRRQAPLRPQVHIEDIQQLPAPAANDRASRHGRKGRKTSVVVATPCNAWTPARGAIETQQRRRRPRVGARQRLPAA